ncbi:MAG: SPOR domain-containing protein [Sandarakinorhabdus sp.]|jgi:cell division septation protein DedD
MAGRDEDAPWLAEAPPLAQPGGAARRRPMLNIAIAVLALGAIAAVGLLMLLGRKDAGSSQGYMEAAQAPLIEADAGPYKVAPENREGLELEGNGEVIHEAARGEDVQSQIDLNAVPEEPIGRPRDLLPPDGAPIAPPPPVGQPVPVQVMPAQRPAQKPDTPPAAATKPAVSAPAAQPVTKPAAAPAKPLPKPLAAIAAELKKPAAGMTLVQIGAFSSEAKANEEWARVAGKGKLTGKRIEKLTNSAGRTLWRVRGQTSDANAACQAILAAKGACEVVKG